MRYGVVLWMLAASGIGSVAQSPAPAALAARYAPAATADASVAGGTLHGVVKSGNIPLPGVSVTAENTLTGKRYATTSDITGAWSMTIPQNGRYVVRTQFAAFAPGSQEAVLNATGHDRTVNFSLILASRAAVAERAQAQQSGTQGELNSEQSAAQQMIQQLTGNGAGNLSLTSALNEGTETGSGTAGASGTELPSIASNSDFGGDSVAITGQTGQVSPMAGVDIDQLREQMETYRQQNGGQMPGSGGLFGGGTGFGGGGFGGGGFGGGGFRGGGFGGDRGGGGGGRGNFRGFNPGQPHGAIGWNGSNSIFNAQPFALLAQQQNQPSNGSNHFTLTFMSAPYIPHLTKPSGKDTVFLTLAGSRSSTPDDFYATLPTDAERNGDFTASGLPHIYNPVTGQQFAYNGTPNMIPSTGAAGQSISPQARALLKYFPEPNLASGATVNGYNYHLLTTAQSNSTNAGIRYNRSFGANAGQFRGGRGGGFGGGRRGSQNQGLRQSINLNYNWSHSASDHANLIPELGGKTASDSYSLQAGYTVGYHRFTSIFNSNWNRSDAHTINFFTNTADNPAGDAGIAVPNNVALNYGVPGITLSQGLQGLSDTQPSFSISQTISLSEVVSWIHGKHNLRFGGDYRRVHRDFLAGSNATGNFAFTGLFTEQFVNGQAATGTGSSFADFLLGLPQSSSLNSSTAKSYLRENVLDAFAMDDWRALPSLTLNYGLRWEFYAPYVEKYGHLADVATSPNDGFASQSEQISGTNGLPGSLVYPWHKAFQPRIALAWRVPKIKQAVVRAGFGTNYTVGEYATFANLMAHQPPFTNEQTNQESVGNTPSTACVQTSSCFTLQNGFPAPAAVGNYALDPHYGLPYVMAWNLDVQKTWRWGIVMNLGYNGSRSNHLDVELAPRALPQSPGTDPSGLVFNYDEAGAFYKMNAATVRVNKRLTKGFAVGANYQYSHAIDDATSVNGSSGSVVQNWLDPAAEEANSSIVPRHQVTGTYVYELPFGYDKTWVTTGVGSHLLEGFSISGSFSFASGSWLSPGFEPTSESVECGNAGALRPNLTGAPVNAGGGLHHWFNTAAYAPPSATSGYCNYFGNAPRNSIEGPGTVSNNMSLSKTVQMGDTRSMEVRAMINNVFNTVQYSGVDTTYGAPQFGQVTSVGQMRQFQFMARFRF